MQIVIKTIIIGVSAIFLLVVGVDGIFAANDMVAASNYLDNVSEVIMESNYNETVILECRDEAIEKGYVLEVTVSGGTLPGAKRYAEIKMTYPLKISLVGFSTQITKQKVL